MLIHWLWLAHHPGLKDLEKARLLAAGAEAEELYFGRGFEDPALNALCLRAGRDKSLDAAQKILEQCAREGLRIVTMADPAYPRLLKNIADPPLVLYCKGNLPDLEKAPPIAVVGTRKATAYGLSMAEKLGRELAQAGAVLVTGMAAGIDAAAAEGALAVNGRVIGVLGCGAEMIYPRENARLFRSAERSGCILSEFPPGTPPAKWRFPKRNRIISGLSCAVLVVEAPQKSGALITANQALEQGRDVFVVPGNVDQPTFAGSFALLRDGAIPASSGAEIVREYEARFSGRVRQVAPRNLVSERGPVRGKQEEKPAQTRKNPAIKAPADKKVIDKAPSGPYIDLNKEPPKLTEPEAAIAALLEKGERQVDEIIAATGLTAGKLLAALTMLEVKGLVVRLPGKRVKLRKTE